MPYCAQPESGAQAPDGGQRDAAAGLYQAITRSRGLGYQRRRNASAGVRWRHTHPTS